MNRYVNTRVNMCICILCMNVYLRPYLRVTVPDVRPRYRCMSVCVQV